MDRIKNYSATICGADGEEKVEFPNLCEDHLAKLLDVCLPQGFPVLVDSPIYGGREPKIEDVLE